MCLIQLCRCHSGTKKKKQTNTDTEQYCINLPFLTDLVKILHALFLIFNITWTFGSLQLISAALFLVSQQKSLMDKEKKAINNIKYFGN